MSTTPHSLTHYLTLTLSLSLSIFILSSVLEGTGDVQITLSQCITFTGAVIVTTPHELSLADATKGVAMFQDLRIPTLAVVSGREKEITCHLYF